MDSEFRSAFFSQIYLLLLIIALPRLAPAQVVINEFYYDAPGGSTAPEFIELYNMSTSAADISGWKFDSGVDYIFPAGTTIPAQGYYVITADPAVFQDTYGFAAAGPWSGELSNKGEHIRLRGASNQTIDDITYTAGFPWPAATNGEGSSAELTNPIQDNSLPGSWRSSGQPASNGEAQVYVPVTDESWHYRKGTSEASSPTSAWRELGFIEDGSWLIGRTSVGFGDNDDNTLLSDMQNNYTSVYLRRVFNIDAGQVPNQLRLRVRVDDGCVVWINGVEVARFYVPSGELAYNSTGMNHDADLVLFEETILQNASSYLVAGENVIAIHAFNTSLSSSDFTIDAELLEHTLAPTSPTPGAQNSVFSTASPPSVDNVVHSPNSPVPGSNVSISARVQDPDGIASVTLAYQSVLPGGYIRRSDPAYETGWTNLAMHDDGVNGDVAAGDGIYTAVIPSSVQTHRRLVRYRVQATDSLAHTVTVPYSDDGSPNFAYFVYGGIPSWSGSFHPGITPAQTFTSALLESLPTYHLIATKTDITNSQYDGSFNGNRMWGTLVYNGQVFDHIQFNNRGEYSTYTCGKNKWRIHFNTTHNILPHDNWGRVASEFVDTLNLNANASPWCAVHRGTAGMEEAVSFRAYELAGLPSPRTTYLHFRVIDGASETSTSSQFEGGNPSVANGGDLWGLYSSVEHPDGSFLDEQEMADGNVYKIEAGNGDLKHHGDGQPTDGSDWNQFFAGSNTSGQTESWWRANLNLPAFYTFAALNRLLGNVDLRTNANHLFYHAPDGHWTVIPWDLDMMFIPKVHQSGYIVQNSCLNKPAIAVEYRNRAREILDLFASDASTSGGQIGQLIDEYSQLVYPPGQILTWGDLDAAMWNQNPRTTSAPSNPSTNHRGNFFQTPYTDSRSGGTWVRTLVTPDHAGHVKYLTDYATNTYPSGGSAWAVNNGVQEGYGYKYLESDAADTNIPIRPAATCIGPVGFPIDKLYFQTTAFADPQGAGTFAALQWRIAEISAPGIPFYNATLPRIYELTDVWRSTELTAFVQEVQIPFTNLQVGHTYRVRIRHKDQTGRWSRWSEPVQFVAGDATAQPTPQMLAITELMYNPSTLTSTEIAAGFTDKQDFEFIELKNISSQSLDLNGVAFTAGIAFAFPSGATLAPGDVTLVAKNLAAFNFRYGSSKPVAGAYTGSLDNSGETIVLSFGAGTIIHSFVYSDGSHPAMGQTADPWPTEPDGTGYSLVLKDPALHPDYAVATSWRSSRLPGGSPGANDTTSFADWANNHPGIGSQTDDPDSDTHNNGAEYSFGSDPTIADPDQAAKGDVQMITVNSQPAQYLTITFKRQIGATDLDYAVQFSSDLVNWTQDGVLYHSTLNGDGTATETWRSTDSITSTQQQFVRVQVIDQ